jgi:tight adherence protein C
VKRRTAKRVRERDRSRALIDALNAIADSLRSGASLRQAFDGGAGRPGSPFHEVAASLREGRPLVATLHAASVRPADDRGDADVAAACCVLAVHAGAGGDPLPAVRGLAERVGRRQTGKDEARALTTQSRLGARTILLLTPAFLILVGASDPRGLVGWFAEPRIRAAILTGLALQGVGTWWITSIISTAAGSPSRLARVPVLRALHVMLAGRATAGEEDVASCADCVALVSDAGLSATACISAVAPYARGAFGDALRRSLGATDLPLAESLSTEVAALGSDAGSRFARAVTAAVELGVPLAPTLRSLSDDIREQASIRLAGDIRRASVRVLVPLGVLVLPAFVLACLVPLFVGGLEGIAG